VNAVWQALASLTRKERMVLALRFRHEKSPDEIGRTLGESRARVRELEASALGKLHERLAPLRFVPRELFPR
jgi:RNA polymerase sigma factor (sigma-70 family)